MMRTAPWHMMGAVIGVTIFTAVSRLAYAQGATENFARYATPTECAMVAPWYEHKFWRDQLPDTLYVPPSGRLERPTTVTAVRACLTRFTLATTPARDLLGLGQAYLGAEQPEQAAAAFAAVAKNVASAPAAEKSWALYQIVSIALGAPQPQLTLAEKYLAQLDAMSPAAAENRMLAHTEFAKVARIMDSVPLQERELSAALKASGEIQGDQRKEYAYASADVYIERAFFKARQNDGPGAVAELDAGKNALVVLRPRVESMLEMMKVWFTPIGQAAPPIQASLWANTGAAGDKRPVAGKPSLIVFVSPRYGAGAYGAFNVARRMLAKYGAKGLDVTLVTRTSGYFGAKLVAPDTEVAKIRHYYMDVLKLPMTLAVWKTATTRRDDGRIMVAAAPNEEAYQPPQDPPEGLSIVTYLIDSKGMVRLVTGLGYRTEAMIDHVLQSMM